MTEELSLLVRRPRGRRRDRPEVSRVSKRFHLTTACLSNVMTHSDGCSVTMNAFIQQTYKTRKRRQGNGYLEASFVIFFISARGWEEQGVSGHNYRSFFFGQAIDNGMSLFNDHNDVDSKGTNNNSRCHLPLQIKSMKIELCTYHF
mmetsp:Transcript_49948/g.121004  ORF Transcript_49948/g.121004 Transcript_49948/m.121004 type:complete len:146 (-) Transcript_49948:603-1040(-)